MSAQRAQHLDCKNEEKVLKYFVNRFERVLKKSAIKRFEVIVTTAVDHTLGGKLAQSVVKFSLEQMRENISVYS